MSASYASSAEPLPVPYGVLTHHVGAICASRLLVLRVDWLPCQSDSICADSPYLQHLRDLSDPLRLNGCGEVSYCQGMIRHAFNPCRCLVLKIRLTATVLSTTGTITPLCRAFPAQFQRAALQRHCCNRSTNCYVGDAVHRFNAKQRPRRNTPRC